MQDTRKVQTAVLGSPRSHLPVVMPFERIDAELLRKKYATKRFFCGEWLGGCGKELYTRIGPVRVPHFAHHPEGNEKTARCRRASTDEQSADHLYIQNELTVWLQKSGHPVKKILLEGTLPREGGICTGMTIKTKNGGIIAISLRNNLLNDSNGRWLKRDAEMRRTCKSVDWLFGRSDPMVRHMTKREGRALMIKCESVGHKRVVKIGTKVGGRIPLWANLYDCEIDSNGNIQTPQLVELRKSVPVIASTPAQKEKSYITKPELSEPIGFPVHATLFRVKPRSITGDSPWEVEAEISCDGFVLPATSVKIIIAEQEENLTAGLLYHIAGPATLTAIPRPSSPGVSWTLYVRRLISVIDTQSSETPPKDEIKKVNNQISRQGSASKKPNQRQVENPLALMQLSEILDCASREVATLKFDEAKSSHSRALELFKSIPIKEVRHFQSRLNEIQRAINQNKTVRPSVGISPSWQADRNEALEYISLIEIEIRYGRVSYVTQLCRSLEKILSGTSRYECAAEFSRLSEFKKWISDNRLGRSLPHDGEQT